LTDTCLQRVTTQQRKQHKRKCGAHSVMSITSLAANSSANVLLRTIRLLFWLVLC